MNDLMSRLCGWGVLMFLSLLDWTATNRLYQAGVLHEANPLARWMLDNWGIESLLMFKCVVLVAWLVGILYCWRVGQLAKIDKWLWLCIWIQGAVALWASICAMVMS